jgi:hypothetical protein
MSTDIRSRSGRSGSRREHPWLNGYAMLAVAAVVVLGLWQGLAGITAVLHDGLYVTPRGYVYALDIAGWGWTELVIAVLTVGAGVVVLLGRPWGELVAIVLAALSMVVNFLLIPYFPIWSVLIIALSVVAIWAVAAYQREVA